MAQLGYIGDGIMGRPIARYRLDTDHDVALSSMMPGKAERALQNGTTRVCASPAEVATHRENLSLCLGNTTMAYETIFGEAGTAAGAWMARPTPLTAPSSQRQRAAMAAGCG